MNTLRRVMASLHLQAGSALLLAIALTGHLTSYAQSAPAAPDVLVLSDGDTLHGKFVNEIGGKVTFHTDSLGDVSLTWDKIKELHSTQRFAVLDKNVKLRGKKTSGQIPIGTLDVDGQAVTVHETSPATVTPIPVKNAQYIVDEASIHKEIEHEPSLLSGWNGAVTAGGTVVTATQNQYTLSGAVGVMRTVPSVSWLDPRNRTSMDFQGSYGKITQPSYTSGGVFTPGTMTKSAIYHADAERDQFFSPRFFALAQLAYDHNFSQDLDLQQIYGGGIGWTVLKTPKEQADLKATMQYEKQQFISGASGTNQNLIGSTFSATYVLHEKR